MTTSSSGNINPLHHRRVKGREIIITEKPRLPMVRIPTIYLSNLFHDICYRTNSGRCTMMSFQTYCWPSFCRFILELNHVEGSAASRRYCYGELRRTRLNSYALLLFRKFHIEQVHGEYGDFLGECMDLYFLCSR